MIFAYVYDIAIMAKTIAVSDDVYKKLKKARIPGESFSSTIKRSLEMKPRLSDVIGTQTLTREDWREAQRVLAKSDRKTLQKLTGNA
jgi:predicted CopG family antitoxin